MNILVSGSSGLVGSALVPFLTKQGHNVRPLVRPGSSSGQAGVPWNPQEKGPDSQALSGIDAVVHLAGENIVGRWTASKKRAIYESRPKGTRLLVQSLLQMKTPPRVMVSASAIGYYGDRGDEVLREDSPPGKGFLPDVCKEWEQAAELV